VHLVDEPSLGYVATIVAAGSRQVTPGAVERSTGHTCFNTVVGSRRTCAWTRTSRSRAEAARTHSTRSTSEPGWSEKHPQGASDERRVLVVEPGSVDAE
jgi:hypothetical protein